MLPQRAKYQKSGSGGNDMIASSQRDIMPPSQRDILAPSPSSSSWSSFHRPFCFALLWSLSASVPCGFFPLGGSVTSVLFSIVVNDFHFRAMWNLSTRRRSVVRVV